METGKQGNHSPVYMFPCVLVYQCKEPMEIGDIPYD